MGDGFYEAIFFVVVNNTFGMKFINNGIGITAVLGEGLAGKEGSGFARAPDQIEALSAGYFAFGKTAPVEENRVGGEYIAVLI